MYAKVTLLHVYLIFLRSFKITALFDSTDKISLLSTKNDRKEERETAGIDFSGGPPFKFK
jgi:hypothetical protein